MASFVKYYEFADDLCTGVHNLATAGGDTLKLHLSNTAGDVAQTVEVVASITPIAYTNVSETWPADTTNTGSETTGTFTVAGTDCVATASGGAVATFRYVILWNDTPTAPADPLIGSWDYGSAVDLADGESFTVDFGASIFTVA